jgi:hypothetical protein
MLDGIKIFCADAEWMKTLEAFGAAASETGLVFSAPNEKITASEIFSRVENLKNDFIKKIRAEKLSPAEKNILFFLPASAEELKKRIGYSVDSATHTAETLIYNIRKKMTADFVRLENGEYKL